MSMEIFDVVDEFGKPTGETIERTAAHSLGIKHRTAHIWVTRRVDGRWQVLLQKRAADKDSFPGYFDTSAAGHIQAGDEPEESAVRELFEELGIKADAKNLIFADTFKISYEREFYGKIFRDNEVSFVYMYPCDVDAQTLQVQKEELDYAAWFDLEEVFLMCENREASKCCVPLQGLKIAANWCNAQA